MNNRAESRFQLFANRRKNSVAKQERRSIHTFEPLEERQLLSLSDPIGIAAATTAVCGHVSAAQLGQDDVIDLTTLDAVAESKAAITVSEAETIPSVDLSSAVLGTSSTGGSYRVFEGHGGNLGVYTSGQISFTITIDAIVDTSKPVELTMQVWDVDYNGSGYNGQPERDVVSINGHQLDGYLTGANEAFSTCTFNVDPTYLMSGDNTVTIDIDTLDGGWLVECDWAKLRVVTDDLFIQITGDDTTKVPVTNSGVNFEVKSDLADFDSKYTIEKVDWEVSGISGGVKTPSVSEKGSESGKTWTWTPGEGEHGLYFLNTTVTLKDASSNNTFQIEIEGDFDIFFNATEQTNPQGICSNWLYYWIEDGAVSAENVGYDSSVLLDFLKSGKIVYSPVTSQYGAWDPNSDIVTVTAILTESAHPLIYNGTTVFLGGTDGIDTLAQTFSHEFTHRNLWNTSETNSEWVINRHSIAQIINRLPGAPMYLLTSLDSSVFDSYTYNGDMGPEALRSFLTNGVPASFSVDSMIYLGTDYVSARNEVTSSSYFVDTWNNELQLGADYYWYGDNELYARLAEIKATTRPENDWADFFYGRQSFGKIIQYVGDYATMNSAGSAAVFESTAITSETETADKQQIHVISHKTDLQENEGAQSNSSSERMEDIDSNGIYDTLKVTTNVFVQNADSYGMTILYFNKDGNLLYDNDFSIDLQSGTSEIEISIPVNMIDVNRLTDNSSILLYLFDSSDLIVGSFDSIEVKDYSEFNLENSVSVSEITEKALDVNNNGLIDSLVFDLSISSNYAGTYGVSFTLYNEVGDPIATTLEKRAFVPNTPEAFSVSFDGNSLYRAGYSGTYTLKAALVDDSIKESIWSDEIYTTEAYSVNQFEGAQAKLNNQFSERAVDSNADGIYDNLTISVGFDVAVPSNYRVYGRLVDGNGNIIESSYTYFEAEQGANDVDLVYDSQMIAMNGSDGPYTLSNLYLTDMNTGLTVDMLSDAYTTEAYSGDDFNGLKVVFTGESDFTTPDDNNNGKYDSLDISIGVNVNVSGNYRLVGYVYDVDGNLIDTISKREYLYNGNDKFNVSIPGPTINDLKANGPYTVRGLAIYDGDLELVTFGNSIETNEYQFDEFESQRLAVSDDITDYLDESGAYLCVTFKATSDDGGYYNANARLMDSDGAEICWASTNVTLVAGEETEITLKFSYNDVIRHGVPGELTVKDFSLYNQRNTSEAVYITEFYKTQYYGLNVPVWNLDDYSSYKSFKLDATPDSNVTATLYGLKKDGKTYEELQAWDFIGTDAVATITGRNVVAENLWITESAAALLGGVEFNGGELLLDKLTLDGTAGDDAISISTETVVVETPIFTSNPYEKALENYRKIYGETSPCYIKIAANLDAAYQQLSKHVARKTSTWGVVDINGMTSKFLGARDVTINAGAGADAVQVDALHYNYTINAADANALDFSNAQGRLNLDLGANYRQCAIVGDGGTLQLGGAFTTVVGTPMNDHVIGAKTGLTFNGLGGSDSVTLVGGENTVELVGPRQSVVARGNGVYGVVIENGDYSVVNAGGVTKTGEVNVAIQGKNATVFAGLGALGGAVEGDYATINAGATQSTIFGVEGAHAVITTGVGADIVSVTGDYATITTGAGNDIVDVFGGYENVHLGLGDDFCALWDGESNNVGYNYVWCDAGDDSIMALMTTGTNFFYAGAGNDVILGGMGDDSIYANSGNNILIGLDGVDRLYGGSGRDVLIASSTDALANVDLTDEAVLEALYAESYQAWNVDNDVDAMVQILGEHCLADGAKDWLYRGSGRRNLVYASQLDVDFENALERSPFNDELKVDQR